MCFSFITVFFEAKNKLFKGPDILTDFAIHICTVERDTDTETEIEDADIVRTEIIYIDN